MMNIEFIDLFAGIGGVRIGFENAGFKCVFSNDFDSNAKKTFDLNFAGKGANSHGMYLKDITKVEVNEIPNFNVLCGGFPCQPFSVAGKRKGFSDENRGNLFFDIIRIIKAKNPDAIFLENVKNLKNHDKGNTLKVIYSELKKIGYKPVDQVLNASKHGNLPQNRERIYIVAFKNDVHSEKFQFPKEIPLKKSLKDCLEVKVPEKYYYNGKPLFEKIKNDITDTRKVYQWRRKYVRENKSGVCPTLTANMGMGGHNVPIVKDERGIRKITPRECANFQGFPKNFLLPSIADSHLYKQFGNSVPVPVVEAIAKNIKLALT